MTNQRVSLLVESACKENQWSVEGTSEWYLPLSEKWNRDVAPVWRNHQRQVIGWVRVVSHRQQIWTRPMEVRGQTL